MVFFLDAVDTCRKANLDNSPSNTAHQHLQHIQQANQAVRALVHVAQTAVQDEAAALRPESLLAGVPLVVKDLIDVAGMPTRLGSQAINHVPAAHAAVVASLIQEGALIAGKSHTTEFAMSGWGVSPLGRPLNPIDAQDRFFTGGSSNGSGSAIAAGLVPAALGTDTGGSIRIPSSFCGLTGLKGSPGWTSADGIAPLSQRFDAVGPMARTAAEVRTVYRAMLPAERRAALETGLEQAANAALPHLVFLDDESLGQVDAEVLAAYRAAQTTCEQHGFSTHRQAIPCNFTDMAGIWADISGLEGYLNNRTWAEDTSAPLEEAARRNLLQGKRIDLDRYFEQLNRASICREKMERLLTPGHLLVVPTTSTPAMPLTGFDPNRVLGIYTRFVNLIQGCSIAVPNGLSQDKRPTSMQFVGAYGQDAVILHAALHWQAQTDWHEQIRQQHQQQMQTVLAHSE